MDFGETNAKRFQFSPIIHLLTPYEHENSFPLHMQVMNKKLSQ